MAFRSALTGAYVEIRDDSVDLICQRTTPASPTSALFRLFGKVNSLLIPSLPLFPSRSFFMGFITRLRCIHTFDNAFSPPFPSKSAF